MTTRITSPIPGSRNTTPPIGTNTRRSSTCTSGKATAGKPATKVARIDYDYLHEFDVRQADSAVEYIKKHAKDDKPFFMDVNFMKMHNPNIPAKAFIGKSHLGNYSDAMMELDSNIGKVMDEIRAEAPNTIVIITADNGAWQDAWPDAGTRSVPRGERVAVRGRFPCARHHVVRPARFRPARVMAR